MLLTSIARACRLKNDKVLTRLPIKIGLLETMLFEIERIFESQAYLSLMYKTIFIIAYYGLFRIGELTYSPHAIAVGDVLRGVNKNKFLFSLKSSKTHAGESRPQNVKITKLSDSKEKTTNRNFCPFELLN